MNEAVHGDAVVLSLSGEVDLNATPEILQTMKTAFKRANSEVVLDLGDVRHIDSSGIAAMVEGVRHAKKTGKPFLLSRVPDSVKSILDLAKLLDFFQYRD